MSNPTADWERVGDKFYRKVQLYTAIFDQDLELENYIISGCSYGGAIGMYNSIYLIYLSRLEYLVRFSCLICVFTSSIPVVLRNRETVHLHG